MMAFLDMPEGLSGASPITYGEYITSDNDAVNVKLTLTNVNYHYKLKRYLVEQS